MFISIYAPEPINKSETAELLQVAAIKLCLQLQEVEKKMGWSGEHGMLLLISFREKRLWVMTKMGTGTSGT
jgi:hypothetical protein